VPDGWYHAALGPAGPTWSNPWTDDGNFQIKVVERLTEQLSGSDFNMSVFLGELPQTINLLADTAIRIRKSVTQLRRGDLKGASRFLFEGTGRKPKLTHDWRKDAGRSVSKGIAQNWLELQYGWLPLLKDAEGAAQSIAHVLHYPFVKRYRATARHEDRLPNPTHVFGDTGWVDGSSMVFKVRKRAIVAYIQEDPNTNLLAALGVLDPELVAWELVPFSFVADWFIPIGQWMEQRAKASRLVGTFVTTEKITCLLDQMSLDGVPSSGYLARVAMNRSISTSLDVPLPNLKGLDKAASWQHCANAIALVTGMFSKGK